MKDASPNLGKCQNVAFIVRITIYHSRIDLPSYESTIAFEVLRARATAVASCSGAEADETQ